VPAGLAAAAASCTQVNLSWGASTDTGGSGLKGYNVYTNGSFLKQILAPATSTAVTGLSGGTLYSYVVTAIDNAGNQSSASNSASASTPACNVPPIANAGPDVGGTIGAALPLNGSSSSDPDGTIMSYSWTFGDGATGSGAASTHSYAAPGAYTATLTVMDNAGATASDTATVTVTAAGGSVLWRQGRGGAGFEVGQGVAVDGDRNVIVTGTFTDTADFGASGALRSAGEGDVFLAKYTAAGTPVWAKRFGGTGADIGYSVAVDRSANCDGSGGTNCIVVAGLFSDTVNFGGAALTSAGIYDIFLAKYSAAGTHLWSKRFGNIYEDVAYGVAVDASGNVVLTGFFSSETDFGGGTLFSQYFNRDAFVAKFAPSGTHLWSKNFWSTSTDVGNAVAIDGSGDVALTGFFTGALDFGTDRFTAAGDDIFVAKLAGADGHAVWAKKFGGADVDRGQGIACDRSGNVIITGLIYNGTVDFGGGPLTTGYNQDAFVAKLTGTAGAHVWSKLLGGANSDGGLSVTADGNDNVTVAGYFQGTVDFGGTSLTSAGNASADLFVASYAATGAPRWVKGFGGTSADGWQGGHVATDAATNEVIVTSSFETIADFGGGSLTSAGSDDVCVVKLQP
jgi:chitodextrinase